MLSKTAVKRAVNTFIFALAIPLLAGCVAEQRLAWSPDGRKMALVGADGVRISTDGGMHLGDPVEEDAQLVAWFPDSKRVAVVSKTDCDSWAELEKTVDKEEVEAIKTNGDKFLNHLEKCQGNFAACRDSLIKDHFEGNYMPQVLYYLRTNSAQDMQRLAGREWAAMKPDSFTTISYIKIFELEGKNSLHSRQTLSCTTRDFDSVKVSPSNEFVCLVDKEANLCLVQTSGAKGLDCVALGIAKLPDWDVDTDVIYAQHSDRKTVNGKEVVSQEIVSIDARKPSTMKRLARVQTTNDKVRATIDGNLIFGSQVIASAGRGRTQTLESLNLFNLGSGKSKNIYHAAKGDRLQNFEVSPDGKKVSIPNASGQVKVVMLPGGQVRSIVAGNPKNDRDVFTPVWKNNYEVCFEKIPPKEGPGKVALFSLKTNKSRDISIEWPESAIAALMGKPDDKRLSFEKLVADLKDPRAR